MAVALRLAQSAVADCVKVCKGAVGELEGLVLQAVLNLPDRPIVGHAPGVTGRFDADVLGGP